MPTLASVARDRKSQLKSLMIASRRLDADQEKLEREIKRIVNRKKGVPELEDAERLATLATKTASSLDQMVQVIQNVATSWGSG